MTRLTRRQLAEALGVTAAALAASDRAVAQTASPQRDWYREAIEGKRAASKDLSTFDLPPGTEPAFQFKA